MSPIPGKAKTQRQSLSLDWDKIFNKGIYAEKSIAQTSTIRYSKNTITFCTGSSYTGKWNILGMTSDGTYCFPHGCQYVGGFLDGQFHGRGEIRYPMGQRLCGIWNKGEMISCAFNYTDGMEQVVDYCIMPDRRFLIETREGLQAPGREYLTNHFEPRRIPDRCYDTGDGFYNIDTHCILEDREEDDDVAESESTISLGKMARITPTGNIFWVNMLHIVSPEKAQWITKYCRKAWDEPIGYKPEHYEDWCSGRSAETDLLDRKYKYLKTDDKQKTVAQNGESKSSEEDTVEAGRKAVYAGTGRKLVPVASAELR